MQCRRQIERDYSAQNACAKISRSPNLHAKVQIFSYFVVPIFAGYGRGSRKSRKFGPRENFPLYGIQPLNKLLACVGTYTPLSMSASSWDNAVPNRGGNLNFPFPSDLESLFLKRGLSPGLCRGLCRCLGLCRGLSLRM